MKKKIVVIFMLLGITNWLYGQNMPEIIPKYTPLSPEAATLSKYINYPVNHGTGLVDISIPLYTITDGDITVPITLNYHASGLKVSDNGGWVGAGWTLNAEPSVTRSVEEMPDENYYLKNPLFTIPSNATSASNMYSLWVNGGIEKNPDKFYFKLNDKSGGFYFEKIGSTAANQIVVHPYEPVKIKDYTTSLDANRCRIDRFDITDDNGIQYTFGGNDENSIGSTHSSLVTRTQWKAKSVTSSKTSGAVYFSYHPREEIITYNLFDKIVVEERTSSHYPPVMSVQSYLDGLRVYGVAVRSNIGGNDYFIDGSGNKKAMSYETIPGDAGTISTWEGKIKEISFSEGTVTFTKSGNKLLNIVVTNIAGEQVRKITFTISQMGTGVTRNKLDAISVLDGNNNVIETYFFGYNSPTLVPSVRSKAMDHWGYYNGATSNDNIGKNAIPRQTINLKTRNFTVEIGDANREPSEMHMKYGILNRITYPTGGTTTFEYETNRYKQVYSQVIKTGGGLRIKSVTSTPLTGEAVTTVYTYGENGSGVGFCNKQPALENYMFEQSSKYTIDISSGSSITTSVRTYSSNMFTDLYYDKGAAVVYDYVKETTGANMVTLYQYAYSSDIEHTPSDPTRRQIKDYRVGWRLGELLSKTEYKNGSEEVHKTEYNYSWYKTGITPVYKAIKRTSEDSPEDYYEYSFNILKGCKKLLQQTETYFYNGITVANTTKFNYDASSIHMYPRSIESDINGTNKQLMEFTYPHDIRFSGEEESARQNLIAAWQVNTLLQQTRKVNNIFTESVRYQYKPFNMGTLLSKVYAKNGTNTEELKVEYKVYNEAKNPVNLVLNGTDEYIYIWGLGNKLIAEIRGANFNEVTSKVNLSYINNVCFNYRDNSYLSAYYFNPLRTLGKGLVTTYTYKPLVGITTITDPATITTTYDYDSFGRLLQIKDSNSKILEKYTYNYKK